MEWLPVVSVEVVKMATSLLLSVPVPMFVPPSLNVTVPVGVPDPVWGLNLAVKVTA